MVGCFSPSREGSEVESKVDSAKFPQYVIDVEFPLIPRDSPDNLW
jgi:hypothetical protein